MYNRFTRLPMAILLVCIFTFSFQNAYAQTPSSCIQETPFFIFKNEVGDTLQATGGNCSVLIPDAATINARIESGSSCNTGVFGDCTPDAVFGAAFLPSPQFSTHSPGDMVAVGTVIELYYAHNGIIDSSGIFVTKRDTFCIRTFAYEDVSPTIRFDEPMTEDSLYFSCEDDPATFPIPLVLAEDNCLGVSVSNMLVESTLTNNNSCNDFEYEIKRTWIATDDSGNTDSLFQWIFVEDNFGPNFDVPKDTTINCGEDESETNLGTPTNLMDDCQPLANLTVSFTDKRDTINCLDSIRISRTWKVEDACQSSQLKIQTIWVIDSIAPTFILPKDTTVNCESPMMPAQLGTPAMVSDNCDATVTPTFIDAVVTGACDGERTILRTWTAQDTCGKTFSDVQTINVIDTLAPAINRVAMDTMFQCGTEDAETLFNRWISNRGGATATDNCGGQVIWVAQNAFTSTPATFPTIVCDPNNPSVVRERVVDFLARDACGNADTTRATFRQIDTIAPNIITCMSDFAVGNDQGMCGATVNFEPPRFIDNCFDQMQSFDLKDSSGLTSKGMFGDADVIVDTVILQLPISNPSLTVVGNSISFIFNLENVDAEIANQEFFNIFAEDGTFLGRTEPTDIQCGNSTTTITITNLNSFYNWITDGIIEFRLAPNSPGILPGRFSVNNVCIDSEISVSTQFDANVTSDVSFQYAISTNGRAKKTVEPITNFQEFLSLGEHEVTYCIIDCGGNIDSCKFTVTVNDTEAPVIICPADIIVAADSNKCASDVTIPLPPNALDNCGFAGAYSSEEPSDTQDRLLTFYSDPNIGDFLSNPKQITFSGITGNAAGSTGLLTVHFIGDMDSLQEYFIIRDETFQLVGTTEVGQPNVNPGNCSTAGSATFIISDSLINAWGTDGSITFNFNVFNSFVIPPAGIGSGINPCGTLSNQNGGNDGTSMLWAELSFDEITPTYFATGATSIANTNYGAGHNATHTFNVGVTDVSFFVDDVNGNRDTCTFQIQVEDNERPLANCTPLMVKINPSGTMQGTINPADVGVGSTDNCNIASMTVSPSTVGCDSINQTINVQLFVEDDYGNRDSCTTIVRIEGEEPEPSFNYQCGSDTLFLFANPPATSASNGGYTYRWTGPNNSLISTSQNPIITNPSLIQSGSYCVEIIGLTGCTSTGCLNIPLDLSPPQPTVTGPSQVCWDTDDITLNTTPPSGSGGQVSYNWFAGSFPNGTLISSTVTPSFVMSAPHNINPNTIDNQCFYVTITINGCESLTSNVLCIDVVRPPNAVVTDPTRIICENETLQLFTPVNGSSNLVFNWQGPGFNENIANPVVTTSVDPNIHAGNYEMILFLEGCASNTATTIVNVLDVPNGTPNITPANQEICIGSDFTLTTNLTGVDFYEWLPPTGAPIPSPGPSLTLSATSVFDGPWRVRGVVSFSNPNTDCYTATSDVANVVVNTFPQTVVAVASPAQVCTGGTVELQVTPVISGASYVWRNSAGTVVGAQPVLSLPNIQNNDQGTYCVTVTNPAGCVQVECTQIMVSAGVEVVTASNNAPNCFQGPTDVQLSLIVSPPDDGTYTYNWTGPCGFIEDDSLAIVPQLDVENCGGNYFVQVTNGEGCKSNIEITTIDGLAPLPDPFISTVNNQLEYCAGDDIVINVAGDYPTGSDVSYCWITPQGIRPIQNTPTLSISGAFPTAHTGNYFLEVKVDGCKTGFSNILNITVNQIPIGVAQAEVPCEGGDLTLNSTVIPATGIINYEWSTPFNATLSVEDPVIPNADPNIHNGAYTLVVERNGCFSTPRTVNVEITDAPTMPSPVQPDDICLGAGEPLNLCINSVTAVADASYLWTTDTGDTLGMTNNLCLTLSDLSMFSEGVTPIFVTTEKDDCSTTNPSPLTITFTDLPTEKADAGADFTICQDEELILNAAPINDGTGCWKYLGGIAGISFENPCSSTTLVTGLPPGNTYDFVWSLSKGACENYMRDTVSVTIFAQENAFAGPNIDTCNTDTVYLRAVPSSSGLGMWVQDSIQAALGVVILDPSDPRTAITVPGPSPNYFFRWEIPNQVCGGASDEVVVNIGSPTAFAGADIDACGNGDAVLNATTSVSGLGMWTSIDPDIQFTDPFESGTVVDNLSDGVNVFVWTIDNGICGPGSIDTVVVNYDLSPIAVTDTVTVLFGGTTEFEPGLNDIGATNFTIKTVNTPTQGSIENLGNGVLEFTAPFNFIGTDSVTYEICPIDVTCACTQATVIFQIGLGISECEVPSIITPNGDNMNEFFTIGCVADVDKYPNNELIVFNQWGDEVHRAGPYLNDWYGTFKGEELPDGTYFYILDLGTGDNPMTGFLVIQR